MNEQIEFSLENNIWCEPQLNNRHQYVVSLLPTVRDWLNEYAPNRYHIYVQLSSAKLVIYDKPIAVLFKLTCCSVNVKPFRDAKWVEEQLKTNHIIENERIYLDRSVCLTEPAIIKNCTFYVDKDLSW